MSVLASVIAQAFSLNKIIKYLQNSEICTVLKNKIFHTYIIHMKSNAFPCSMPSFMYTVLRPKLYKVMLLVRAPCFFEVFDVVILYSTFGINSY